MTRTALRERIPPVELLAPGQAPCPGCADVLALRLVLKALGPRSAVVMPARCAELPPGSPERVALRVPVREARPGALVDTAVALQAERLAAGEPETVVLAWAGDAATFAGELGALSAAAERNDDLLYVCADRETRLDALIRDGAATPWGNWSTAAPGHGPRLQPARDLVGIFAAHRVPYAATASPAHPVDLVEKVQKARSLRGLRLLHVLVPCPVQWGFPGAATVALARAAVRSRVFPLYEVEDGLRRRLTAEHPGDPVESYLLRQERFRHLDANRIRLVQGEVDRRWEILRRRVQLGV